MSTPTTIHFDTVDLAGIDALASAMVDHLPRNVVIGLVGTLGAGKTTFVQAIARAAGIDASEVTSPTFTLLQTHKTLNGQFTIHHLDAYRVADEDEFLELGVDELFEQDNAWTLVEWADLVKNVLPQETLWLHLDLGADDLTRAVRLQTVDGVVVQCCQRIADHMKASSD